jgi:ABC-type glycerol-3-phosphate transport system permease component
MFYPYAVILNSTPIVAIAAPIVIIFGSGMWSKVITAIIWISLFNPDPERGLINALLVLIPGVNAQNFLGDINQVMACVFVVLTWKFFGLHMLLFMAGLQNIPKEIEECAMADGCTRMETLLKIILPLSTPGLISAGIFCFTLCWNEFLYALIFMSSGPMKTIPVGTVSDLIKADTLFWGSLMASAVWVLSPLPAFSP